MLLINIKPIHLLCGSCVKKTYGRGGLYNVDYEQRFFLSRILSIALSLLLIVSITMTFNTTYVRAAASGIPGSPSVTHDNWDKDGNYTITMSMWWGGNNGTSWKLYENDVLIHSGDLIDDSPNAQTGSKVFSGKANGTYNYKCELINAYGTATSSIIAVEVNSGGGGDGPPSKPLISVLGDPYGGLDFDIKWNIHSGQVADSWELYESSGVDYQKKYSVQKTLILRAHILKQHLIRLKIKRMVSIIIRLKY